MGYKVAKSIGYSSWSPWKILQASKYWLHATIICPQIIRNIRKNIDMENKHFCFPVSYKLS